MRVFIILFCFLTCTACGLSELPYEINASSDFYVVSVSPAPDQTETSVSVVELVFSEPLWLESVDENAVMVVDQEFFSSYETTEDFFEAVEDQEVLAIQSSLTFSDNADQVYLLCEEGLAAGESYVVIASSSIQSQSFMPLDQRTAGDHSKDFVSTFHIQTVEEGLFQDPTLSSPVESPGQYPETAQPVEGLDGSEMAESTDGLEPFDWARVLLTEVVTDPQQDHNESEGGNESPFDSIPGDGSATTSDEFVEIFNGTPNPIDLTGWQLNMVDGTDELQDINDPSWESYTSTGSDYTNLLPGEFLVLGNPQGQMNNTITVELISDTGDIIDIVDIEDANADDESDESYQRDTNGEWFLGPANPGEFLEW